MKISKQPLFSTLTQKIIAITSLVLVMVFVVFVFLAYRTGRQMMDQQAHAKAHGVAEFGINLLEDLMMEGKPRIINKVIKRFVAPDTTMEIHILKKDCAIVFSSQPALKIKKFAIEETHVVSEWKNELFIDKWENDIRQEFVIMPIPKTPACLKCHEGPEEIRGFVVAKISIADFQRIAAQHKWVNITMTVLSFLVVGVAIFLTIAFVVLRPLKRLRNHVRAIENHIDNLSEGEQSEIPLLQSIHGSDEIANLSKAFDDLVIKLNRANAKIHELHQKQMEQADRLGSVGEMAASIAHEIKNPVAGVTGALQVFDAEIPDNDPRKEIFREMMSQMERINHAINDLLNYARVSPPVFEFVNIHELIERTLSLISQQTKKMDIQIHSILNTNDMVILADKKLLQQVLWNIMYNALQAMDSKGTLTITTWCIDSTAVIRISDTGKGIPKENLQLIFKPFFSTKHKGTGLGLSICKRIVDQHQGSIFVESEIGKGTLITLKLPIQAKDR